MCRIAGIADRSLSPDSLRSLTKNMCDILAHGGPDDEGVFVNESEHVALGNRRLALIDLSHGGHQPMSYANERYQITYNGELYNYPELKEELIAAGCVFKTKSDTEVILASFSTWGINAFRRFNGMFAFALWDSEMKTIYLVRDPSGIKPLYFAANSEHLVFASEIRAFKPVTYLQKNNPDWQVYLMAYGHLPEPVTTLKDVKPLTKGHFLSYQITSGKWSIKTYNHFSFIEKISNRSHAIDLVATCLKAAVERNLLADAKLGVFLSGGLDSGIIAKLADDKTNKRLNTISIYFEEKKYSEKNYQDVMSSDLAANHFEHLLKYSEFREFLPAVIKAMDQPSSDGINTWFISKYAHESGLKAVLSGIGGDELFGGYPSFHRIDKTLALQQMPNNFLRKASSVGSKLFRRMSYLSINGIQGVYLFLRGQFIPPEIAQQTGMDVKKVWNILSAPLQQHDIHYLTPHNQASWMEINMYMQNQLLRDADVMSMA
ncbi:MAG: asparagine synthase (glutamine-hydrolyzing), partial [Chitinophagaceae bacterium]|nr:asparagine synthase (glutamine-hydrolyzing) [Chitinophagaceae bacterium]